MGRNNKNGDKEKGKEGKTGWPKRKERIREEKG